MAQTVAAPAPAARDRGGRPFVLAALGRALMAALLTVAVIFFLFPIFWIFETSFKNLRDAESAVPKFFDFTPTLDNYRHIFVQTMESATGGTTTVSTDFPHFFLNSIVIDVVATLLALVLGTLAAYGFSRFPVPAKNDLLFFILSTRMLPPVAVLIPIFLMYTNLNLVDTYHGMILLYTTFNIPFAVWMMKGFIDEIPREYEDAAMVDGYTRFQAFYKVIVPQSLPAAAATSVFLLITVWNEFVFATQLTQSATRTAPPGIAATQTMGGIDWGLISAVSTLFVLPVVIFTFLVRNYLLRGVTFGAVRR
jgi:multiple sugar transport system permease protein